MSANAIKLCFIVAATWLTGSALYFQQPVVHLKVPADADGEFLLRATALLNASGTSGNVTYRLQEPANHLRLDPETGELFLKNTSHLRQRVHENANITATAVHASGRQLEDSPTMMVELVVVPEMKIADICNSDGEEICFWDSPFIFTYQVFENRPATELGYIRPPFVTRNCSREVKYKVLGGSEAVAMSAGANSTNSIRSRRNLDREAGGQHELILRCSVGNRKFEKKAQLIVLDEDDNAPRSQKQQETKMELELKFSAGTVLGEVIVRDNDTLRANKYEAVVLDGMGKLVTVNQTEYEFNGASVLHFKILARSDIELPGPNFTVPVMFVDTSLIPGISPREANFTLNLTPIEPYGEPTYPKEVTIPVAGYAYMPVTRPKEHVLHQKFNFSLADTELFGVTRQQGIVYVARKYAYDHANITYTLTVQWTYQSPNDSLLLHNSSTVLVRFTNESFCEAGPRLDLCASKRTKHDCKTTCGFGAARGCAWRKNGRKNVVGPSSSYSTCTTNQDTCPDDVCDELEAMEPQLCPQDCTLFSGVKGHDSCWCDVMTSCSCGPQLAPRDDLPLEGAGLERKAKGLQQEPTTKVDPIINPKPMDASVCGQRCAIFLVLGVFVFLTLGGVAMLFWRARKFGKGGRRDSKYVGSMMSLSATHSDYIDRGQGSEQLMISSQVQSEDTLLSIDTSPRPLPDKKWEFPRSRLVIDQTLGEGEFGRVLKATALDIAGTPGYTTVAVKTLKEGASPAELADLLSEYQLLKDVNHPNVIRLLGACTSPGEPVYLIIEYAELGSLRNYLRKTRHLAMDGQPSSSTDGPCYKNDPLVVDYSLSPRDLLSFAWQISKGMSYLSDIKLVHRDLAARNVLLARAKICKISDFGLTRDVYEDDAYLKRSKGRVPVKWMALESLSDHVYTCKSDVWSFGVLLWELVTLGASPYPGVAIHNLYYLLQAGYRMERPDNCSDQLYQIMRHCWDGNPANRPTFKELTATLDRMLQDGMEYLDLNPHIVHNRAYFNTTPEIGDDEDDADEDLGYGNLNILKTESNYLTKRSQDENEEDDDVKLEKIWSDIPLTNTPTVYSTAPSPLQRAQLPSHNNTEEGLKLLNRNEDSVPTRGPSAVTFSEPKTEVSSYESPIRFNSKEQQSASEKPVQFLSSGNSLQDRGSQNSSPNRTTLKASAW